MTGTDGPWPRCPEAAAFCAELFHTFATANPAIEQMAARFRETAGVRLEDLTDHWALPATPETAERLREAGFVETQTEDGEPVWAHPRARLPRVRLEPGLTEPRLALATEDLPGFLKANDLRPSDRRGDADSGYEEALCRLTGGELAVVVRSGYSGFVPQTRSEEKAARLAKARRAFRDRARGGDEGTGIDEAGRLFDTAAADLGPARAVDEFFQVEREFYLGRNRAARWQYGRQQEIGIGWANHDHHTYRSSRPAFRALTQLWNRMGFVAREKFYAGAEAGWGAQIFEHPVSRVVLFCDVDMAPEELDIDFAQTTLQPRNTLGTIGLWCALHGCSIAQAGMHHLEAEYDWERAKTLLEAAGFGVMAPFTDLPILKQAFTQPEIWPVEPARIQGLLQSGSITEAQADGFRSRGAPGSHLEILQRWEGFKGFNKTGVSAIIRDTDARLALTVGGEP